MDEREKIVAWLKGISAMMAAMAHTNEAKWALDISERIERGEHDNAT